MTSPTYLTRSQIALLALLAILLASQTARAQQPAYNYYGYPMNPYAGTSYYYPRPNPFYGASYYQPTPRTYYQPASYAPAPRQPVVYETPGQPMPTYQTVEE